MSKAVGIDLGTTNSVAAHIRRTEPRVIDNLDSEPLTPSVVHLTEGGECIIGKAAKMAAGVSPEDTVFSIKRFMGRDFNDPTCSRDIKNAPYKVVETTNGEVEVVLRGRRFSPPEISAFILESMKRSAETSLDEAVAHAVITVPAYFGTRQKAVTRLAGRLAGLEVMKIVPEPTAAALAYGFDVQAEEPKTLLVYDLGGGTFDVTVMFVGAGLFQDQGKSGDMHLGGDDFDHKIMDWIIEQVRIQHNVNLRTLPNNSAVMHKLKENAELAKIRLSTATRTQILIPGLVQVGNKLIDVECELTRQDFGRMIKPLVDHSIDLVHDAIKLARTMPDQIDAVLLVGGPTRIPLVEEAVRQIFGEKVIRGEVNPMHCVAQGAAIETMLVKVDPDSQIEDAPILQCRNCGAVNLASRKECRSCGKSLKGGAKPKTPTEAPTVACPHCSAPNPTGAVKCKKCGKDLPAKGIYIEHATPHSIGVEVVGEYMEVIIPQQTPFPTTTTQQRFVQILKTRKPGQEEAHLPVYEGEDPVAKKNQYLGIAQGKLPPGLPEGTNVEVELAIDTDGILKVTASLPDQPEFKIEASIRWAIPPDEIPDKPPKPVQGQTSQDEEGIITDGEEEWKLRAQYMLFLAGAVREEGEDFISSSALDSIMRLGAELMAAVQSDNENKAESLTSQMERKLNEYGIFAALGVMRHLTLNPEVATQVGSELIEKLNRCVEKADRAKQNRNLASIMMAVAEGQPTLEKIMDLMQRAGSRDPLVGSSSDYLLKRSGK